MWIDICTSSDGKCAGTGGDGDEFLSLCSSKNTHRPNQTLLPPGTGIDPFMTLALRNSDVKSSQYCWNVKYR